MLTANMTCLDGLRRAYEFASNSLDPSTQTGAVLIDKSRGVVFGVCNQLVKGSDLSKISDRDWKYRHILHAEQAIIMRAAETGYRVSGLTLVCPWAACTECAKAIIASGISEVIAHKELMAQTPDRWKQEIADASEMFRDAGVAYHQVTGKLGVKIRFDGKDIEL